MVTAGGFVLTVGFAVATNAAIGDSEADNADFDALHSVFIGLNLGQIAAIAFGTTAMSSEYQGGAIRASLTAVPNRSLFYAAKLTNVAGLALALGLVTTLVSFLGEAPSWATRRRTWATGTRCARSWAEPCTSR